MRLADGIRKHGFRKWYERELVQGHAYLLLTFVCSVGVLGAADAATSLRSWGDRVVDGLTLILCAATGLWALRRYLYLLAHAEAVAQQANCPSCKTYGRVELLRDDKTDDSVQVRCRHCSGVWRIEA